jgi:alkaline phosphatase
VNKFTATTADKGGAFGNYVSDALGRGYRVALTEMEMNQAVNSGTKKVLGLFSPEGMTPEYLRPATTTEPRLPAMTAAALRVLDKQRHKDGFFLMVEGSQIDWANHGPKLGISNRRDPCIR